MPIKQGIGYGEFTETKQSHLSAILGMHLKITNAVLSKNPYYVNRYLYIDATSGPGIYPIKKDKVINGSPLIFLKAAESIHANYLAHLWEEIPQNVESLKKNLTNFSQSKLKILQGKYQDLVKKEFPRINKKQLGLFYVDPSSGIPDVDSVRHISNTFPRLEILMYLSGTNVKRDPNMPDLVDAINSIKKRHWLIRRPFRDDTHQWTFLLGSNSNIFDDYKSIEFFRLASKEAASFFPRLNYTKKGLLSTLQHDFFDLLKK